MPTLRPGNAARYATLGRLLLKHRGAVGEIRETSDDVAGAAEQEDVATAQDAEELTAELIRMGPTFVKLGQLLSTRVDLLPPVYLDALSALREDVRPISADEAIAVVEAELDVKVTKLFRTFNRRPIGAASLGQVHKATLRDGRTVAVKVQRPDVRQQTIADMEVISELANFVDEHSDRAARVGFGAIAEQFRRSLLDELDYRMEASNLQLLGQQLSDHERILVPQPITDLSTTRVLTMEFVPGRSVSSIPDVARAELDLPGLADELVAAYLDQMLVFGFMHADPHPGNVLLTEDHRVALIDLGMVVRLSPQVQEQMLRLLLAISNRDGEAATEALAHLGSRLEDYDAAALTDRVSDLILRYTSTTIGELAAGRLLSELAVASTTCGLRPRPELSLVARALLSLDEVARTLDPDIQADEVIQSHASRIMRQRMLKAASPTRVMSAALEATALAEALPSRLNKVLESLAEGQLTINLQGLDETAVLKGAQKLANRVATGVLIAAFVVAAALFSRATRVATLWGYPVLTVVFLGLAILVAVWLMVSIMRADIPQGTRRG